MRIIVDRTRPQPRTTPPAPSIREVCLMGSPARRYVHLALDVPKASESGRKEPRFLGTG